MYNRYLLGVGFKVLSLIFFSLLSLIFANVRMELNSLTQYFFICIISSIFLLPFIYKKVQKTLNYQVLKFYLLRVFFKILAMLTWIEAIKTLGASEATLAHYLTPILTIFIANLFKEEKIKYLCLIAGLICYAIIYFTLNSEFEVNKYGFYTAIFSSFCWGFYNFICKKQTHTEHYLTQAFNTFLLSSIALVPFCFNEIRSVTSNEFFILSMMAIISIANLILLFLSIKYATLNWLAPVSYMRLPIISIMGYLFFNKDIIESQWQATILLILINIIVFNVRKKVK